MIMQRDIHLHSLDRIDRKLKSKQHIKYISKLTKISNSEEYRPESCRHMTAYEGRSSSTSSSSDASNFLTSPASSSYSDALDLSVVSRTKRSRKFASKPWTRPKKASDSQTAQRKRPDSKDGAPSPHDHYTALAPYRSPKPQTVSRSTTSVYSRGSDDHSTRMPRDGGRSKHTSSDSGSADRTVISLVVSDDDGDDDDMDDTASALSHYEGRSKINIYSDECSNYNSHSHNNGEKHTKTYSRNSDDTHTHGFSLSDEDEAFKFDDEDDVDERHNMSLVPRKPSSSSSFYKAVSRQHTATNQDLSSTSIESDSSFEDLDLELY